MPKNVLIKGLGMGWPVGQVVPPQAFPGLNGYRDHLKIGAVSEVDSPITAGHDLVPAADRPQVPKTEAELTARVKQLEIEVVTLTGKLAGETEARKAAEAEAYKAMEEVELHKKQLDTLVTSNRVKAEIAEQNRLDSQVPRSTVAA